MEMRGRGEARIFRALASLPCGGGRLCRAHCLRALGWQRRRARSPYRRDDKRREPCRRETAARHFAPGTSGSLSILFERTETYPSGEIAALYLRDGKNGRILAEENIPITDQSRANISSAYKSWRKLFGNSYRIVDITGWVSYEEMTNLLHQWKSPYVYDERKQQWVERRASL
jgi:hypothetical protein